MWSFSASLYVVICDVIGLRYLSFEAQNDSKRNVNVVKHEVMSSINEIEIDSKRNKKMI